MKLAVLSDLHIGKHARCPTLRPTESSSAGSGLVEEFVQFLEASNATVDYLFLPGDIGEGAAPEEIQVGSAVVEKIATALHVPQSNIFFVPGNHDVDWDVLRRRDKAGFWKSQRYAPINNPSWIFSKIATNPVGSLFEEPYFGIWSFPDLYVVGHNSSWHDDPSEAIHYGNIKIDHLKKIEKAIEANPPSPNAVRLFLIHHHSYPQPNPLKDQPEFSALINAADLLAMLRAHRFDLLIHGHRHCPHFETIVVDSGHPLAILCAGSFSLRLLENWANLVGNQFHIVEVDGRASAGVINGRLRSWSYVSGIGWTESKSHHGIRHVSPFGAHFLPEPLRKDLESLITGEIEKQKVVTWERIVALKPEYQYLTSERVLGIASALATQHGWNLMGDPTERFLIWKE